MGIIAAMWAGSAAAQHPQQVEEQVRSIIERRPQSAEAAARAFLRHIAPARFTPAPQPGVLDTLRLADVEAYWREVAQLTVQFEIFQSVLRRDSARAPVMAGMFGAEFEARELQRAWRGADESGRRQIRTRLEAVMRRHFDLEQQLRQLEMRDIERRLAAVRDETARRAQRRDEHVRYAVEGIIRDAERP